VREVARFNALRKGVDMKLVVVDVEADGPIPGEYSMISFAAVLVDKDLQTSFQARLNPISPKWDEKALSISGHTREETLGFPAPLLAMQNFETWLKDHVGSKPVFISDNNGFDWMFVCWYFWKFLGRNPFGYSSRRLSDLVCGIEKDLYAPWKGLRKTPHTHDPLDDARGNAEVLLELHKRGLKGIV